MSIRCYRHTGPNGPEDTFFFADNACEGQALALRNIKKRHPTVARGPVPRAAWPPCRCANRSFRASSL